MEEYLVEKLIPKILMMEQMSDKVKLFLKFLNKVVLDFK